MKCPCKSEQELSSCCEPFLLKRQSPATAEQLMRSRYTAYTQGAIDYLIETTHLTERKKLRREDFENSCKEIEWLGLEILEIQRGSAADDNGTVTFIAKARNIKTGFIQKLHECSSFEKEAGQWKYITGFTPQEANSVKLGRNAPCPCSSRKKYKQCCL